MDDPIFDPWGGDVSESGSRAPRPVRWRSPAGPLPTPPATDRQETAEAGRLPGTRGYLRSMAVPRIAGLVQRLRMAQHEAAMEDLLEETPPLLRVTFRPRRGPFIHGPPPPFATLEVELQEGANELVFARWWIAPTVEPTGELSVSPSKAGGAWLDQVFIGFVEQVLERVR